MSYHPKYFNTKNISQQKTSHRQRYQVTNSVSSLKGSCNQKHLITIEDLQREVSYNPKKSRNHKRLRRWSVSTQSVSTESISKLKTSQNWKRLFSLDLKVSHLKMSQHQKCLVTESVFLLYSWKCPTWKYHNPQNVSSPKKSFFFITESVLSLKVVRHRNCLWAWLLI